MPTPADYDDNEPSVWNYRNPPPVTARDSYYTPAAYRVPAPQRPPPPEYRQVDPAGSLQPTAWPKPYSIEQPSQVVPASGPTSSPPPPAPAAPAAPPPTPDQAGRERLHRLFPGLIPPPQVAATPGQGTLTPPPDKQGNRYWNPVAAQQPFADQINRYAHEYGIPPALLSNLLRAESNFNPQATGPMTKYGQAGGIAQFIPQTAARYHINPYDPDQGIRGAAEYIRDLYNEKGSWAGAVAAYNGAKSIDVSQYRGSPEGRALIANAVALDGGLVKAGPLVPPPQNYRPVSYTPQGGYPSMVPDRPMNMWGRDEPGMFEGPGAIPHQREIGGILGALAPFLMIGLALFSKGAALPMLSAYSGFAKARAARQDKDAKELKTYYQDKLKETKAKLGLEQGDAAAAMALPAGPQRDEALRRIALEYGDSQLEGIINNGGDPTKLFQLRDKAYQDISKTNTAEMQERRFELSQEEFMALEEQRAAQNDRANAKDDRERKAADDRAKAAADKAAAAKKAREDLEKQFPGSTLGGGEEPSPQEPGAEKPAESPEAPSPEEPSPEAPTPSPTASPTPAPAPEGGGAPPAATPEAAPPSSRWGPGGPPPGYNPKNDPLAEPDAKAAPSSAPAPVAPPRAQKIDDGRDQVIPPPGAPRLIPVSDVEPAADEGGGRPPAIPRVPPEPSQAAIEDAENNTYKLGRTFLHGGDPPQGMRPGVNQAAEIVANDLGTKLNGLATSGLTGQALVAAVRKIDNRTADMLDKVMTNHQPLPSASGFSARMQNYMQRIQQLAFAGAPPDPKTGDPGWDPGQWQRIQDFKDDNKRVQFTLSRANTMSEAYSLVMQDLKNLQDQGIAPDAVSRALANFNSKQVQGDPTFTSLSADLQRFTQEEQFLVAGQASVTETERGIQSVFTPVIPGSPEQIRGYMKNGLKTAAARVRGYEHQWKMMHAPGEMYGSNPDAQGVMAAVPYLNIKTGSYDNLPKGMILPPDLAVAQPTVVPKGWHPDDYK